MKIISSTTQQLTNSLNRELREFVKTDFQDYFKEVHKEMIDKHVYSYEATDYAMYERRKERDGLSDMNNLKIIEYPQEGAFLFINNTFPQEIDYVGHKLSLAEAVEVGDADWNMHVNESGNGPGPRPFMQETVNKLHKSPKTYSVFRNYFLKKGLNTIKIK